MFLVTGGLAIVAGVLAWYVHVRLFRRIGDGYANTATALIDSAHWTAYLRREKRRKLMAYRRQTDDADLSRIAGLALVFEMISWMTFLLGMGLYALSAVLL